MSTTEENEPKRRARGSLMLQRRRAEAEVLSIISLVLQNDERCHYYAKSFVLSDIKNYDDICNVCTNDPDKLYDFGLNKEEVTAMTSKFGAEVKDGHQICDGEVETKKTKSVSARFVETFANITSVFKKSVRSEPEKPKKEGEQSDHNELRTAGASFGSSPRSDDSAVVSFGEYHTDEGSEFKYTNPLRGSQSDICNNNEAGLEDVMHVRIRSDSAKMYVEDPAWEYFDNSENLDSPTAIISDDDKFSGYNECNENVAHFEIIPIPCETGDKIITQQCNPVPDNSAFVFIKPHANVSAACRDLVRGLLKNRKIDIVKEGEIMAESIDKDKLIDQHYYAIGSKAVMLKPTELDIPEDKFESAFNVSWQSVLNECRVYNAMDACTYLDIGPDELDIAWAKAKGEGKLVKLGGGFYCGYIDTIPDKPAIYVINGFYMSMRSKFVQPGSSIYYFCVEWSSSDLSFSDFRNKVLGCTDPTQAPSDSIRGIIMSDWRSLGLSKAPNTGDNGVHASASPFEALAERMNWLGVAVSEDSFGRKLLDAGVTDMVIKQWSIDPSVDGRSVFDTLEELDCGNCVAKALELLRNFKVSSGSVELDNKGMNSSCIVQTQSAPTGTSTDDRRNQPTKKGNGEYHITNDRRILSTRSVYTGHIDNSAFVFIKPHANVSAACRDLVRGLLKFRKIDIVKEGEIMAESIDKDKLIDQHYYAIGSKAVMLKPTELDIPEDKFESAFNVSWQSVLNECRVYNAMDACTYLDIGPDELDIAWAKAKGEGKLVKLGGGFYCGYIDTIPDKPAIYVINGFYMSMRSKFVQPGSSIYYFCVEWSSSDLSFSDFRNKVLGCTDPTQAPSDSIRGIIMSDWRSLGLSKAPNTGDNGVHASASPFEALAERMNWLGVAVSEDSFGRKLLDAGVTDMVIKQWSIDPSVDGRSVFDTLEELDCGNCVAKALELLRNFKVSSGSVELDNKGMNSSCIVQTQSAPTGTSTDDRRNQPAKKGNGEYHITNDRRILSTRSVYTGHIDNSAFVFIKPHANVSAACRDLVRGLLKFRKIDIVKEGEIMAESIDKDKLIDQHYYAIGSKAVMLKPTELDIPEDKFESAFNVSWQSVLNECRVYNAMDACTYLDIGPDELDIAWAKAKGEGKLVKLGGGFYCGYIDTIPDKPAIYVINGFYMSMRSKFVQPGSSIYYFCVEWSSSDLSFSDFRNKVLGCTDPTQAPSDSIRGIIMSDWRSLGLSKAPNTGDNGVHASASPFEALAERMNWLGVAVSEDSFGRKLLDVGIPEDLIQAATLDPQLAGKSVFDMLENLDCGDCVLLALEMSARIVIERRANESQSATPYCQSNALDVVSEEHTDCDINYVTMEDGSQVQRRLTRAETEVRRRRSSVHDIVMSLPTDSSLPSVSAYIPIVLSDAIFCGHLVTDLDSIAGAIGAAELYGGVAARASEVNSETQFALDYWGVPTPLPVEKLVVSQPGAGICLVDHQQMSQVNPAIDPDRIVGVIDHHALQNATIVTDRPIYMDIRPWGSMSTIIAHTYLMTKRRPRKCIAGMLLCAILSDTLNLMGPTTTEWDKMMVAVLCEIAGVNDIEALAKAQFRAKSKELENLSAEQLVDGDMKVFSYNADNFSGSIGFAVIETTDDGIILARSNELLASLKVSKQEKSLDLLFLAVVNIVSLQSTLLVVSEAEKSLAEMAFPASEGGAGPTGESSTYFLGPLVSRKKDFVPALSRAINKEGWQLLK